MKQTLHFYTLLQGNMRLNETDYTLLDVAVEIQDRLYETEYTSLEVAADT